MTSGDFDADGFADLAVGAIGEDRPNDGTKPFGAVTVLPGSEAGVSGAGSRRFASRRRRLRPGLGQAARPPVTSTATGTTTWWSHPATRAYD